MIYLVAMSSSLSCESVPLATAVVRLLFDQNLIRVKLDLAFCAKRIVLTDCLAWLDPSLHSQKQYQSADLASRTPQDFRYVSY